MLIRKQDDWITAKIGGEIVMMNAKSDKYIGLNNIGARIWDILETPQTTDELCAALVKKFKVTPEACRAEVDSFLAVLVKNGAVTLDSPKAA